MSSKMLVSSTSVACGLALPRRPSHQIPQAVLQKVVPNLSRIKFTGGCVLPADAKADQERPVPNLSGTIFTAVENTDRVHNLIVCTLCSCYPLAVLGMSPAWYKSRSYRARAVRDPRGVLKEFGTELGPRVAVRVHDSTADMR